MVVSPLAATVVTAVLRCDSCAAKIEVQTKLNVCNVSARSSAAGSGCADFMCAWHFWFFLLTSLRAHKIPRFRGLLELHLLQEDFLKMNACMIGRTEKGFSLKGFWQQSDINLWKVWDTLVTTSRHFVTTLQQLSDNLAKIIATTLRHTLFPQPSPGKPLYGGPVCLFTGNIANNIIDEFIFFLIVVLPLLHLCHTAITQDRNCLSSRTGIASPAVLQGHKDRVTTLGKSCGPRRPLRSPQETLQNLRRDPCRGA